MLLEVRPDVFDRVQLRRVSRKAANLDPAVECIEILSDELAAVSGKAVPDDDEFTGDAAQQMIEEDDQVFPTDSLVEDFEVEVPDGQTRDQRKSLPVEVMEQNGRLSPRCPSAASVRTMTQPAFVDEDDRAPFCTGFFLMAGQVLRFHSAMAASFLSIARPTGRWGLQFSCRSTFQTWPGW